MSNNNISNEQFNNIVVVEPFKNSNDNIGKKKHEKRSRLGKDKDKLGHFFVALAISVGVVITTTYMGANLVFYKWALQPLVKCSSNSKSLFDVIFPTECNEPICSGDTQISSGGSNKKKFIGSDIKECIVENSHIADFCKTSISKSSIKFNLTNPGLKEWFVRSYKLSNLNVHEVIKYIIEFMPTEKLCWITFLSGILILPLIILLVVPLVSWGAMLIHMFKEAFNNFSNNPVIWGILLFILGIGFAFPIASVYSVVLTLLVFMKLVFLPITMGGKDTLLRIVGNNLFLINILVWIISLVTVITASDVVNKNIYTGILIAYIPLSLLYLYKIFS